MSKIDNFKWKNWINTFKNRKEDINRNSRPKKSISGIVEQLKVEWYEKPTQDNIMEAYLMFIWLNEDKIKEITIDKEQSMLVRIVWKHLLSGKWFDILEKMIDRTLWKPKQTIDTKITDTNVSNPLFDRLKEIEKMEEKELKENKKWKKWK